MAFPEVMFGKCPVCGGSGGDDPDPGDGFVAAVDLVGNGYELVLYRGEWMCKLCKKRKISEEESRVMSESYRQDQEFLDKAGFKKTMQ